MFEKLISWIAIRGNRQKIAYGMLVVALGIVAYSAYRGAQLVSELNDPRNRRFLNWWEADAEERLQMITVQRDLCPGAPFILPADGYIGLLYGDPRGPYSTADPHQGIDIFSPGGAGETPVYAAYDGYLTREEYWTSAVIIRVPDDPLHPGRQIWLYYTHMAESSGQSDYIEEAFPPGTQEVFVEQGTLLGYTGNYSGNPLNPVGVHLHFSVVLDNGFGGYLNELDFNNTVDPSLYLGMAVNYGCAPDRPACTAQPVCEDAVWGTGGG